MSNSFHRGFFKLHDMSAVRANQMVVSAFHRHVVVLRFISETSCLGEPHVAQYAHGSIDRAERRPETASIEQFVQVANRHVILCQKCRHDLLAWNARFPGPFGWS